MEINKKTGEVMSAEDINARKTSIQKALDKLPFRPSILVNGDIWRLTISCRSEGQVRHYYKVQLGSTQDIRECNRLAMALLVA